MNMDEPAAIVYKTVPERNFPRGGFQVRALRIIGYSCPGWTFIVSVKAYAPTIHCYSLRKYSHKVINDDRLVGVFDFSSNMCLLPPVSSRSPEGS